jgi:outer membrane protein TolC
VADAIHAQLSAELVAAQRRWDAARRRASSFGTKLVPAQERSTELVRKAYAAGEVDLSAVIQSERDLLDVRAEALAADLAAAEAWATLERAAGGAL